MKFNLKLADFKVYAIDSLPNGTLVKVHLKNGSTCDGYGIGLEVHPSDTDPLGDEAITINTLDNRICSFTESEIESFEVINSPENTKV